MQPVDMTEVPGISIIVPCYNYAHYLGETLKSIADQDFTAWECIIVDDGSKDNTRDVAMQWVNRDPRFLYIHQENGGLSSARNTGIRNAKGKYLQFLDADDLIHPSKLSVQYKMMSGSDENSVLYSSFRFLDENGRYYGPGPHHYLVPEKDFLHACIHEWEYGFIIPIHTILFHREIFRRLGGFSGNTATHEDIDLHLRLSLSGIRYHHHPDVLAFYRVHSSGMSRNYTRMQQGYLTALGNALTLKQAALSQKLSLYIRFGMESAQCFIHVIRGRNIRWAKAVFGNGYPLLSASAVLFLPVFAILKVLRRFAS